MDNLKTTVLEVGGKCYEMRLTHQVLKRISARTKLPMSRFDELMDRYDLMSVMLEEMLRREEPGLSDRQIEGLLDQVPIKQLGQIVAGAFADAFPPEDGEENGNGESYGADGKQGADNGNGGAEGEGPFGTGTKA